MGELECILYRVYTIQVVYTVKNLGLYEKYTVQNVQNHVCVWVCVGVGGGVCVGVWGWVWVCVCVCGWVGGCVCVCVCVCISISAFLSLFMSDSLARQTFCTIAKKFAESANLVEVPPQDLIGTQSGH